MVGTGNTDADVVVTQEGEVAKALPRGGSWVCAWADKLSAAKLQSVGNPEEGKISNCRGVLVTTGRARWEPLTRCGDTEE